jgi:hypothetical protein
VRPLRVIPLAAFALVLLAWGPCRAQTGDEMFKYVESESDYYDLLSLLDAALKEPINLNAVDAETMAALPWVSPWLAARIIELRRAGMLRTLDDLTRIEGVTGETVELLSPFVVVKPVEKGVRLKGTARLRVISSPPAWSPEDNKTYLTLRGDYSGLGAGVTFEKDRYENRLNDFQSFYAEASWGGAYFTAGNFLMQTGYGLVFSGPYGYSPSTIGPWRFSRRVFGPGPYTSTVENFALGGAGVALSRGGAELSVALSSTHLDAGVNEDGLVVSIPTTGVHVSESEVRARDALREDLLGVAMRYGRGRLRAGASLMLSKYDRDFDSDVLPWLEGDTGRILAADLTFVGDEFAAFGEGALSRTGGGAVLAGIGFERPGVDMLALGRKYDRDYLSLHSRPFSAYSRATAGEEGLFLRLTLRPERGVSIAVSNDIHRKDLGGGAAMNPSGSETLFDLGVAFGDFRVDVSEKVTGSEEPPERVDDPTTERARYRTRFDLEYRPHRMLWLRFRVEDLRSREESGSQTDKYSSGLMRLDTRFLVNARFTLKAGFYAFRIEDYSARIYQYEPGLPYYPSLEMLKTDGSRWYLIWVLDLDRAGSATLKFGATSYNTGEDRKDLRFDYGLRF